MTLRIACLFGFHERHGRAVAWDGYNFRSLCRHCGVTLYKHGNVRWRRASRKRDTLLLTYEPDAAEWPAPERPDAAASPSTADAC